MQLKMGSFERIFQFLEKKKSPGQGLVSTERVRALVCVFLLETGGPKSLCVPARCLGARSS
jgi:hypothetical protein